MNVGDILVDKDGCKSVVTGAEAVAHTQEQRRLAYINWALTQNKDIRIAVRDAIIGRLAK